MWYEYKNFSIAISRDLCYTFTYFNKYMILSLQAQNIIIKIYATIIFVIININNLPFISVN